MSCASPFTFGNHFRHRPVGQAASYATSPRVMKAAGASLDRSALCPPPRALEIAVKAAREGRVGSLEPRLRPLETRQQRIKVCNDAFSFRRACKDDTRRKIISVAILLEKIEAGDFDSSTFELRLDKALPVRAIGRCSNGWRSNGTCLSPPGVGSGPAHCL
jgi:hypothetical protein